MGRRTVCILLPDRNNSQVKKPKNEEIDYNDFYGIRDRARKIDRICKRISNWI